MRDLFPSFTNPKSTELCGGHRVASLDLNITICQYYDSLYSWSLMRREIFGHGAASAGTPGWLVHKKPFHGGAIASVALRSNAHLAAAAVTHCS